MSDASEDLRTRLARERNDMARNRTRLANRRTFLAWCRTSLAFMTFGFLLEKVDAFVAVQKLEVPAKVLTELAMLGKFAFLGGPVLMLFAGWRYYRLEKELGFDSGDLYVVPEMLLFGVILASAVIYLFI
ncbi:DUF202 domain-containing protein [Pseudodesulfovibrio indicus]|uniref:YidH family protein n=1 Tax=Pseudodesulfovibrio indicus TaxID=1716143 RepID=UPI00292CDEFD|nr:DUF202 domain-containing protein [Pseudodesulfovibrio indicus]